MTGADGERATDGDRGSRAARLRERVESNALTALAVLTSAALVVAFYYPTATVLVEAVVVDGVVTLAVFAEVLTDPFYFGELARLLSGESPVAVARALLSPDRRLGIVGFTAYQAVLSTIASVALGLLAAYLLARFEFPGRRTLRSLTIVPFVLPSIMVAAGSVAPFGDPGTPNAALTAPAPPPVHLLFTPAAGAITHASYHAPPLALCTTAALAAVDPTLAAPPPPLAPVPMTASSVRSGLMSTSVGASAMPSGTTSGL